MATGAAASKAARPQHRQIRSPDTEFETESGEPHEQHPVPSVTVLALTVVALTVTACGGGSSSTTPSSPPTGSGSGPTTPTAATTPGVWKGTITSTTTGQSASVVALTGADGHSVWMTTDGRV